MKDDLPAKSKPIVQRASVATSSDDDRPRVLPAARVASNVRPAPKPMQTIGKAPATKPAPPEAKIAIAPAPPAAVSPPRPSAEAKPSTPLPAPAPPPSSSAPPQAQPPAVAAPATVAPDGPQAIARLLAEGRDLFDAGKVVEARRRFLSAMSGPDPDVLLALARSYDTYYLSRLPSADAAPDMQRALVLYERAVERGAVEASADLARTRGVLGLPR